MNPNRGEVREYHPKRVTVGVLVHLPDLNLAYHEHRLSSISLSLSSLIKHANSKDYELMVFDNASCDEARGYLLNLHQHGVIHYLLLSRENVGKTMAIRRMIDFAPGEVFAYADDDVYYQPDWLPQQLAVLDHFPDVGLVSGYPLTTSFRWAIESNKKFGEREDVEMTIGKRIPEEWEIDFAHSIERDVDRHLGMVRQENDIVLEYDGMEAFGTGHHMQYMGFKDKLRPHIVQGLNLMGSQKEFDHAVDEAGLLRLSTIERTTRHIGNVVDQDIVDVAKADGLIAETVDVPIPEVEQNAV
jgi:hypothetical protein